MPLSQFVTDFSTSKMLNFIDQNWTLVVLLAVDTVFFQVGFDWFTSLWNYLSKFDPSQAFALLNKFFKSISHLLRILVLSCIMSPLLSPCELLRLDLGLAILCGANIIWDSKSNISSRFAGFVRIVVYPFWSPYRAAFVCAHIAVYVLFFAFRYSTFQNVMFTFAHFFE